MATWIGIGVIAWFALSIGVCLVVGRMVRVADSRQPMHPSNNPVRTLRTRTAVAVVAEPVALQKVS